MNILKNFFFLIFLGFSNFAILQNEESAELLLEKINLLKKEIESLTASIETNNLTISRLEEANQIRYVDLDKRIHLLETKLLFEETQDEESLNQSLNPLSGLVDEDIDSGGIPIIFECNKPSYSSIPDYDSRDGKYRFYTYSWQEFPQICINTYEGVSPESKNLIRVLFLSLSSELSVKLNFF